MGMWATLTPPDLTQLWSQEQWAVPRAAAPVPAHMPGGTGAGVLLQLPVPSMQLQSPVPTRVNIPCLLWGSLGAPFVLGLSW